MKALYDIYTVMGDDAFYEDAFYEASVLDIEGTLSDGDSITTVIDFVRHMLSNGVELYGKKLDEKYAEEVGAYLCEGNIMTFNKGAIIIDSEAFEKYATIPYSQTAAYAYGLLFSTNGMCINPKKMSKSIKEITYKQANENKDFTIKLVGDTNFSNVDIKCDCNLVICTEKSSDIKLGKINCNELYVHGYKNDVMPTGLSLKSGSVINVLDLSSRTCANIGKLMGKNLTIDKLKLNSYIVKSLLNGFITPNTYIELT